MSHGCEINGALHRIWHFYHIDVHLAHGTVIQKHTHRHMVHVPINQALNRKMYCPGLMQYMYPDGMFNPWVLNATTTTIVDIKH